MSDYRKTGYEELDNLMDTIYRCQRGVHNYEYWGEFGEYEKIDAAMKKIEKLLDDLNCEADEI